MDMDNYNNQTFYQSIVSNVEQMIKNGRFDSKEDLVELKVLIHEYGHALAHKHLEGNNLEYQLHRNKYESEAESISYVVSKYLGFDSGDFSLTYLYAWSKEKDYQKIDDSLGTIVNYSKRIIDNFKKFYEQVPNHLQKYCSVIYYL